jgi:hypothetical protein
MQPLVTERRARQRPAGIGQTMRGWQYRPCHDREQTDKR